MPYSSLSGNKAFSDSGSFHEWHRSDALWNSPDYNHLIVTNKTNRLIKKQITTLYAGSAPMNDHQF